MLYQFDSHPESARAGATARRTYQRPVDAEGDKFETWPEAAHRSHVLHHENLAKKMGFTIDPRELDELLTLAVARAGLVSGRTLWLGGTPYAYSRAASQFNCAALLLTTVYDMVDAFWLLLNGSGVGGKAHQGTLHGFQHPVHKLVSIPSDRDKDFRGCPENKEVRPTADNDWTWHITVGDSAEAWCKVLGKLLIGPRGRCDVLKLDYSNLRGKGGRLKGYGWICNGYEPLAEALTAIVGILNQAAGNLLNEDEIGDIFNWCGTVLSSRRAAEALVMDEYNPGVDNFSTRKKDYWKNGQNQRRQSNNSILFWDKPRRRRIKTLLHDILENGEPGFVNARAALLKCPWFVLFNPCFEIMLPPAGFCNLVSLSLPHFGKNLGALERATYIMGRANYRQTCVDLDDGILQPRWHQTNEALRLCGLSYTGIVQAGWLTAHHVRRLRNAAIHGMYSQADEWGLPRPKAGTTIKPEGTRSKIAGTIYREIAEGMHLPPGEYIFNWINFSHNDPLVEALALAGYRTMPNPSDNANVLVRFPVHYRGCPFQKDERGKAVNREPAVDQLERYRWWNTHWADHNVSATISYDEHDIPAMVDWLDTNWDEGYVATAFIRRTNASLTAEEQGHPYLPQEVVTGEEYEEATKHLEPVEWDQFHHGIYDIADASDCPTGVCPVK